MKRVQEKVIQDYRDKLHIKHKQEIQDYATHLVLEGKRIKKEQYHFDLQRIQQKVQEDHDEILNKMVEVLLNLEEPIPPPSEEELKQAEYILPGIKLRQWSGSHHLEVATQLVPPLVSRRVKTKAHV